MKKYFGYTQTEPGAEKFYIEDDNEDLVIMEAEDEPTAAAKFIDYIRETSLYDEDFTSDWISKNPVYVREV